MKSVIMKVNKTNPENITDDPEDFCIYNGPLKEQFYSVTSCRIESSLTCLLLIPHPKQFVFRYWIEDFICLWKDIS